ncbi:MAG: Zn-binding domain-containing protein, partial [Candidatus Hodarchaeales archaeon]
TPIAPVNRLLQRIGRAGRRDNPALIFIEFTQDPIGNFYANNPDHYLTDISSVNLNTDNPKLIIKHLIRAAYELPLTKSDIKPYSKITKGLIKTGQLKIINRAIHTTYPPNNFNLRESAENIEIRRENNELLGTRVLPTGLIEFYPQSSFLWKGKPWIVRKIIPPNGNRSWIAHVFPTTSKNSCFTKPIIHKRIKLDNFSEHEWKRIIIRKGDAEVLISINSFIEFRKNQKSEQVTIEPISYVFKTKAIILDFGYYLTNIEDLPASLQLKNYGDLMHTLGHIIIQSSQMLLACNTSLQLFEDTILSNNCHEIVIYDNCVGGNGLVTLMDQQISRIMLRVKEILSACKCSTNKGCPKCTYLFHCHVNNKHLIKSSTREFIGYCLEQPEC